MTVRSGGFLTAAALGLALSAAARADTGCRLCILGLDTLLPQTEGSSLSLAYELADQNRNWSGSSSAPAADNTDKLIRDAYYTAGGRFAFAPNWHVQIDVPFVARTFITDAAGPVETFRHAAFGDVQLTGHYSGLLEDGSLELAFGFMLPTGDTGYASFPGDLQIGTGSTDAVLGLSYERKIAEDWTWSGEAAWIKPFAGSHLFKPGSEIEAAFSLSYSGFAIGDVRIVPSLQASASTITKDAGADADIVNSGGNRIALSPGLEVSFKGWSLAGEVSFPVYRYMRGNQLVAHREFKLVLSYALDGDKS
jgi:hypothetical protein